VTGASDRKAPPVLSIGAEDDAPVPDDFRGGVVAIGSFDGVHRGHQTLIASAAAIAARSETRALALTFEPHPRALFQPDAPLFRLSDRAAKNALLSIAGAAGVIEIAFDRPLAGLAPEAFVETILVGRLGVRGVAVGEAFRFGKGRAGDVAVLRALGDRHGFAVDALAPVRDDTGEVVSSGRVRDALRAGDVEQAGILLGYRWFVTGEVVRGDRRGRDLGFPTANIALSPPPELAFGIYAVTVQGRDGAGRPGVASYGVRPTFGERAPLLEVHLFDFDGDLYGHDIAVVFHDWIRGEERFDSSEALVQQMEQDAATARVRLAAAGPGTKVDRALTEWF